MDELLTYRDEATGERVGLPAAEVGRWSAATAALLTDECGLGPGAKVGVLLPPHWQSAVVLLGAWSAGLEVSFRGWSTAGLSPAGPALDASFVAHSRIGSWLDEVPAARFPFELFRPGADVVPGYLDPVRRESLIASEKITRVWPDLSDDLLRTFTGGDRLRPPVP
jgi:hypothetical protein